MSTMTGGSGRLWLGVLAGPTAWLADLGLSYALIPARHGAGTLAARLAVAALAFVVAAAGALLSLHNWRRLRGGPAVDANGPLFLSAFGAAASAFFALVIVATTVPNFVLSPHGTPSENQSAYP
jgi:hypothetical protein